MSPIVKYLYPMDVLDRLLYVAEKTGSGMTVVHHPDAPLPKLDWPDWLNIRSSRYVPAGRVLLVDDEVFEQMTQRGMEKVRELGGR